MPDDLKRLRELLERELRRVDHCDCGNCLPRFKAFRDGLTALTALADRLEKAEALVPKWRQLAAVRRSGNDYSQEQADRLTICARELERKLADAESRAEQAERQLDLYRMVPGNAVAALQEQLAASEQKLLAEQTEHMRCQGQLMEERDAERQKRQELERAARDIADAKRGHFDIPWRLAHAIELAEQKALSPPPQSDRAEASGASGAVLRQRLWDLWCDKFDQRGVGGPDEHAEALRDVADDLEQVSPSARSAILRAAADHIDALRRHGNGTGRSNQSGEGRT